MWVASGQSFGRSARREAGWVCGAVGENPARTLLSVPATVAFLDVALFLKASLCSPATFHHLQTSFLRAKAQMCFSYRVTVASMDVVSSLEALPLEPSFGGGGCLLR